MLQILSSSLHHETLQLPFQMPDEWLRDHQVVAVLTGGTENLFLEKLREGVLTLDEPIYLIASGQSNSLAASMEILTYIRSHQGSGRILTSPDIPNQPQTPASAIQRLGVIGQPSDWLIASTVDANVLRERLGIELVQIPISEVTSLGKVDPGLDGAIAIYNRLHELIKHYDIQGLTLRCFDLLTTVENTGCMALAKLNSEGIPSSCEGDLPTLVTMMICQHLTGCPGFQANPARIEVETGRMLFAHCTIPLSMVLSYSMTTHFESGIGVAIHGELPLGDYTLVKVSGDLKRVFAENVRLTANQYEPNLCRTQVWLQSTPAVATELLTNPIANHHVILPGHWAAQLKQFIL